VELRENNFGPAWDLRTNLSPATAGWPSYKLASADLTPRLVAV
jgi:hypothetical protein